NTFVEVLKPKGESRRDLNDMDDHIPLDRSQILKDLLLSEMTYVRALDTLDEVFVTPLMHIAHGASLKNMRMSQKFGTNMSKLGGSSLSADVAAAVSRSISDWLPN